MGQLAEDVVHPAPIVVLADNDRPQATAGLPDGLFYCTGVWKGKVRIPYHRESRGRGEALIAMLFQRDVASLYQQILGLIEVSPAFYCLGVHC